MADPRAPCIGLVLGGGGARAAYQVGVLKAIAEMVPPGGVSPFQVVCGASAGSINATVVAAASSQFDEGVRRLAGVWENFESEKVFRSDVWSALSQSARMFLGMAVGGNGAPRSILDNAPLRGLLERHIPFDRVRQSIDSGLLRALCITMCSYTTGRSVSLFQSAEESEGWVRSRRLGRGAELRLDHLMASSAIPMIFPAVRIGQEYFGDGSVRQTAPLSPALHLGAEKILVIGVRRETTLPETGSEVLTYPGFGQIAGFVLDTLFLDSLHADIERLQRINQTLGLVPDKSAQHTELRPIDILVISPSQDLAAIAEPLYELFPRTVRYLLRAIGARKGNGRRLMSYLLFEPPFCRALIELGYADTMSRQAEVREFLGLAGS